MCSVDNHDANKIWIHILNIRQRWWGDYENDEIEQNYVDDVDDDDDCDDYDNDEWWWPDTALVMFPSSILPLSTSLTPSSIASERYEDEDWGYDDYIDHDDAVEHDNETVNFVRDSNISVAFSS